MPRIIVLLLFLFPLFILSSAAQKRFSAPKYDVSTTLNSDRSVEFTERVTFMFEGDPFSFVNRSIPLDYCDGLLLNEVMLDGKRLSEDGQGEYFVATLGKQLKVQWRFEPTVDRERSFTLRYTARGAVRRANGNDEFYWTMLPSDFSYRIAEARISIQFPEGAVLTDAPIITKGEGSLTMEGRTVRISAQDVLPDNPTVVKMSFAGGAFTVEPPEWQREELLQTDLILPGVAGGVLLLLFGALYYIRGWKQYPRPLSLQESTGYEAGVTAPPSNHPASIAALLGSTPIIMMQQTIWSTFFSLGERGVVSVHESRSKGWFNLRSFTLRLDKEPAGLKAYETALLDLVFGEQRSPGDEKALSSAARRIQTKSKVYTNALKNEMIALGLFDPARIGRANGFLITGLIFEALFLVLVVLAAIFEPVGLPVFIPVAVASFLLGGTGIILFAAYSRLSDNGYIIGRQWKSFFKYLKEAARGKTTIDYSKDTFVSYLPYVAATTYLSSWVKIFKEHGMTHPPPYFTALAETMQSSDGAISSFAVFTASASAASSTGHSSGGSSGGAGGGGSSGAG